jgi:hypothetical protein
MSVFSELWFWITLLGLLAIIGGFITFAVLKKNEWWIWLIIGIGFFILSVGIIWGIVSYKPKPKPKIETGCVRTTSPQGTVITTQTKHSNTGAEIKTTEEKPVNQGGWDGYPPTNYCQSMMPMNCCPYNNGDFGHKFYRPPPQSQVVSKGTTITTTTQHGNSLSGTVLPSSSREVYAVPSGGSSTVRVSNPIVTVG